MRTIKFRAKGKSDGQWHYGSLIQIGDDYSIATNTAAAFEMCVVAPETVGQFTGLYDTNGKEIYEGDILQSDKPNASLCVVFWSTEKTAFIYRFYWKRIDDAHEIGKKSRYAIGDWNMMFEKDLAVIGNIHDNPELIEKIEQLKTYAPNS